MARLGMVPEILGISMQRQGKKGLQETLALGIKRQFNYTAAFAAS